MKKVLLSIMSVVISISTFGQHDEIKLDSVTKKVSFSNVQIVENTTKLELYSRGREWFVNTFKSADEVIQMDDKESGKLIGKAYSVIYIANIISPTKTRMFYTISIYVKDNKYRYEITDIYYLSYPTNVNGIYQGPVTTYPENWYVPNTKMYKTNGTFKLAPKSYHDETLININNIIKDLENSMNLKNKKVESEW